MIDLRDLDPDALRTSFDAATDPKAVKRLVVVLAYKDGVPVPTVSDRYGIPESTCYAWLERFEDRSIEAAMTDDTSTGRPPKLTAQERDRVERDLTDDPREFGFERDRWTTEVLATHLESTYGVNYSEGHVRRLLAQLSDRK